MNQQRRPLHAFAGHLLDLYRLITFNPRNPHSYPKVAAAIGLRSFLTWQVTPALLSCKGHVIVAFKEPRRCVRYESPNH